MNRIITGLTGAIFIALSPIALSWAQTQLPTAHTIAQTSTQDQIAAVVRQHLTRNGGTAQPNVRRVRVAGDFALATWTRGEAGGQALLRRDQSGWRVLQSGGGAMDVGTLRGLGVPTDAIAQQLLTD